MQICRFDALDEKQLGVTAVIADGLYVQVGDTLSLADSPIQDADEHYVIVADFFCDETDRDKLIEITTVLRAGEFGVYSYNSSLSVSGNKVYTSFYILLHYVFDQLYVENSVWPETDAELEIYFDDSLLRVISLTLSGE